VQEFDIYNITCDEISTNKTGCRYKLIGRNSANVQGTILGGDHDLKYIANIVEYNQITVYDSSGILIISSPLNFTSEVISCNAEQTGKNYSALV